MLKQTLQSYLNKTYPGADINTVHSLGGKAYIRFDLADDHKKDPAERVEQVTERALQIFNDTFPDAGSEIFVLVYEYQDNGIADDSATHLQQQFPPHLFEKFYDQKETINTRFFTKDENGNDVLEKDSGRIIVGKLPARDISVKNILAGIANNETGFEPAINQTIFFFDPSADRAFYMYDDRGCYVFSNEPGKIRDIYTRRNDWIAKYDRQAIEAYFNQPISTGHEI